MLPQAPLRLGPVTAAGLSLPAREVGGDFFNYFTLADGRLAMLVGDVSGKGIGAALLMANLQASLRARLSMGQDLREVVDAIDRDVGANSPGAVYATLFVGVLDLTTLVLRYVNAGHPDQFILRGRRRLDRLEGTGMPVGLLAGHGYAERSSQLEPGDTLCFYTDGCLDTERESGDEMFGSERLEALLSSGATSVTELLTRVDRTLRAFRGTREAFDDATVMAVSIG
jgi:sigma-B regulation protein RsbU (phosphoserine phosphatase)